MTDSESAGKQSRAVQHRVTILSCVKELPENWKEQIFDLANSASSPLIFDGSLSTSLHGDAPPIYTRVVGGTLISERLPWLFSLYRGDFRKKAEGASGLDLCVSDEIESSININIVIPNKGGYEKHFDSNHVTGLLFVTDTTSVESGNLQFHFGEDTLSVAVEQGLLLFFSGHTLPHSVSNATRNAQRLTVVMNYYSAAIGYERPCDLTRKMY
jgi:hypothetical protein